MDKSYKYLQWFGLFVASWLTFQSLTLYGAIPIESFGWVSFLYYITGMFGFVTALIIFREIEE